MMLYTLNANWLPSNLLLGHVIKKKKIKYRKDSCTSRTDFGEKSPKSLFTDSKKFVKMLGICSDICLRMHSSLLAGKK